MVLYSFILIFFLFGKQAHCEVGNFTACGYFLSESFPLHQRKIDLRADIQSVYLNSSSLFFNKEDNYLSVNKASDILLWNAWLSTLHLYEHSQRYVSSSCQKGLRNVVHGFLKKELWAIKVLDATAKIPSGILRGNVNQYGDFDECLSVKKAQYCLAEIDLSSSWNGYFGHLKNMIHSHFIFRGSFDDPSHRIPDFSKINWGICLPKECTSTDLEYWLNTSLTVKARVTESMCRKSIPERNSGSVGEYFAKIFFIILLLLVLTSSIAEYLKISFLVNNNTTAAALVCEILSGGVLGAGIIYYRLLKYLQLLVGKMMHRYNTTKVKGIKGILLHFLQSFAFQRNWNKLFTTSSDLKFNGTRNTVQGVDGIRAISALALLMSHKSVALLYNPYINRTNAAESLGKSWSIIGRTAIIYTDSFMLISGLLNSKPLFEELKDGKGFDFKKRFLTRLFRILPNFIATILFCTYILPNLGSGPLWPLVIEHHSNLCKQYMWRNFIFVHNYFGFENMCLTHTHQLGIDMQLFLLTPFLVHLIVNNIHRGVSTLMVIATLSTFLRFWITFSHKLSHVVYAGITVKRMFDTANFSYILPTHRATIYLLGVLLAFFLHKNKGQLSLSKIQIFFLWLLAWCSGLLAMIGPYHMGRLKYTYNAMEAAIYGAVSPILWGLLLMWTIVAANRRYAGWFGDFLSWRGFEIFSKISYSVYLVQFPVFFYFVGIQRASEEYKPYLILHFTETLLILGISTFLTLTVEMPFQQMGQLLIKGATNDVNRNENKLKTNKIVEGGRKTKSG